MVSSLEFASTAVNSSYASENDLYPLPAFFGLDPELFPENECEAFPQYGFEVDDEWGHWDIDTENKWIRYIFLDNRYHLFCKDEKHEELGYVHVQLASGWHFTQDQDMSKTIIRNNDLDLSFPKGSKQFPWIGIYPDAFKGVMTLATLLTPEENNPLTGLLTTRDGPTRICAKQVAEQLKRSMDEWSVEILRSL